MTRTTTPPGTGNRTIRLADIPIEQRLHAISILASRDLIKTPAELDQLITIATNPGDKGGRITA